MESCAGACLGMGSESVRTVGKRPHGGGEFLLGKSIKENLTWKCCCLGNPVLWS